MKFKKYNPSKTRTIASFSSATAKQNRKWIIKN